MENKEEHTGNLKAAIENELSQLLEEARKKREENPELVEEDN
jgi:hypothetical protein